MAVENRTEMIGIMWTISQKKKIIKVCEEKSVRMSDYIRNVVMREVKKDSKG